MSIFSKGYESREKGVHPFWVMVQKDISDHVSGWRYSILLLLMALTCIGSLYTAMMTIRDAVSSQDAVGSFLFLKLFTVSDNTLPSFISFITFLGPLIGIALGFDAVNSERNKGTLNRIMAQPIHRDYLINAKFLSSLAVISVIFFALGFLMMGMGIFSFGIPLTPEAFWRIFFFLILAIFYVAFWLNLSILFSVGFRQPATSALSGIAIWIFFSVFYNMIVKMIVKASLPVQMAASDQLHAIQLNLALMRISPSYLFTEATSTLLTPLKRTLGPLTMQEAYGAVASPLPLGQSLLLVWPQVTCIIAATVVCFAISYVLFMRQEIRS